MPSSRKDVTFPDWVEAIDDECLSETVKEALQARSTAIRSGAKAHKNCRAALDSADKTLDQIEFGRISGSRACTKAVTAMRKYTVAAEYSAPSARRR